MDDLKTGVQCDDEDELYNSDDKLKLVLDI